MMKTVLLAGTHSGCGKTTVMLAMLQHLKASNYRVATFKSGPDFLDPLWHQAITGRPSYNLDTQMIGIEPCKELLAKHTKHADWAVIEGAMGLFDGRSGVGQAGSAADLAKALQVAVILVVDAAGLSGSIVPLVAGFCDYAARMDVRISGVIANKVGSRFHAEWLQEVLKDHRLPPLLATVTKDAPILPERHLGLVSPDEMEIPNFLDALKVDDSAMVEVFADFYPLSIPVLTKIPLLTGRRVAIARDAVCKFIYPANLDWLSAQGAELNFFSLLEGEEVPETAHALWLPGGYPELYVRQLAGSASWPSIRQFIEEKKPVLAECGGAMLLGNELITKNGDHWPMANVLPFTSKMEERLVALGYREGDGGIKGHEFHHSSRVCALDLPPAFACTSGDRGIRYHNLRASYVHWYFASAPEVAAGWFS